MPRKKKNDKVSLKGLGNRKGIGKKGMKITSTTPEQGGSKLAAGGHKLMALQKHIGFVKPPLAKKLTTTEKWIKKRNFGIKGTGRNPT